jgi:hypothetical protein
MIELNVRLNKNVAGEFDFDALANLPDIDVADLVEFGFQEWELGIAGAVNDPNAEWQGMPECENQDLSAWKSIRVNFNSEQSMKAFAELLKQPLTENTRSIWYPPAEIGRYADKRYKDAS